MLTFAAKPRTINTMEGKHIDFPATVTMRAALSPLWLFGGSEDGKRLVVAGSTGVSMFFDANTGRWSMKGGEPLLPIEASAIVSSEQDVVKIVGNVATYEFHATTYQQVAGVGDAFLYALPVLLGAFLPYSPVIERITITVAGVERGYEVWNLKFHTPLVTQAQQEKLITEALRCLPIFGVESYRRLHAALFYFHRAGRLADSGHTRWEFLAESVLNLAKSLESLFAPDATGNTRAPIRAGLESLGLANSLIETWFMPALLLRSKLDVAHVRLASLDRDQVETLVEYAEGAIGHFRTFLGDLATHAMAGSYPLSPYAATGIDDETSDLLERIGRQMAEFAAPQTS